MLGEKAIEIIRVANEMRNNKETLSAEMRHDMLSHVYFLYAREILQRLDTILPPADHLATFLWLTEGADIGKSYFQRFFLARLTEAAGDCSRALPLYISGLARG